MRPETAFLKAGHGAQRYNTGYPASRLKKDIAAANSRETPTQTKPMCWAIQQQQQCREQDKECAFKLKQTCALMVLGYRQTLVRLGLEE